MRRAHPLPAGACLALILLTPAARAQDLKQDFGAWFAFAGTGHFDRESEDARWRWWFDAHARFLDDSDGFNTSIVRPGVGYDLSQDATLWAGYAWVHSDPPGGGSSDENRIWQQLTWGTAVGEGRFLSRSRLEQRLLNTGDDTGWRFRQFLRVTRPLGSDSPLGLRLWDELFFDLNDTDWGADTGFRQNRLFAGLGWTFEGARHLTLELGYLNQYLHRAEARDSMNHILAATLILSL